MRRRTALLGLLACPLWPVISAVAEGVGNRPKLALLSPSTPAHRKLPGTMLDGVLTGLAEFGYLDGENISFEFRFANHAIERLPALAAELAAGQPDVIYTWTSGGARAAAAATSKIPIIVAPVNEATMADLTSNSAHPLGNVTGLTLNNREQHQKCLQLLKEVAPGITRVGVLLNPLNPVWRDYPAVLNDAARVLAIELIRAEARGETEVDQAFAAMSNQNVDALFALDDSTLIATAPAALRRILELSANLHLPSVSDNREFAREGGLLGLGPDFFVIGHGAAAYIHRILQGAKPGELPVQHPREFELVVNLKTAQELGITIPPSILLRADEVIE